MGIVEGNHTHRRHHEPTMVLFLAWAEPGCRSRRRAMVSHPASSSPELLMTLAEVDGNRALDKPCCASLTGPACKYL